MDSIISPATRRVLVVEDHQLVRQLAATILERAQFDVIAVADGDHAIEIIQDQTVSMDCAVVDRNLPGLNGDGVAKQIRKLRPDLPIIHMSGYVPESNDPKIQGMAFLQKPFTADALVGMVETVLG